MTKLIATRPILYLCHQYEVGDELPEADSSTVTQWMANGVVALIEDNGAARKAAKAIPVTAQPGAPGLSSDGDPDELAGRVPSTPERKRPVRKARKKE